MQFWRDSFAGAVGLAALTDGRGDRFRQERIDLYEVSIGLYQMQEGFKIYWFRSSEKARRDWNERERCWPSPEDLRLRGRRP